MRCDERRDTILLWVMGQLEGGADEDVRVHVQSGCLECAGYVAEARELLPRVSGVGLGLL